MKPAKRFAQVMRGMTDDQCRDIAQDIAAETGVPFPAGKSGKTALRIVTRCARLTVREYAPHKTVLLHQLALMGA